MERLGPGLRQTVGDLDPRSGRRGAGRTWCPAKGVVGRFGWAACESSSADWNQEWFGEVSQSSELELGREADISEHDLNRPRDTVTSPCDIKAVAVVGAGLIGSRWTALFIGFGLDVIVADPALGIEERVRADIQKCLPAVARLARASRPAREFTDQLGKLSFVDEIEDAVSSADFVQESVADDDAVKLEVISRIDKASPASALIASSTSGILPTLLQSVCRRPGRLLVGHPFNPVHIIPLVEVVPGEATAQESLERAADFYRRLGKRPLLVRKEAPGFVANRMQEAIWREMFHLVNDGIATTQELDAAVAEGPGLRWALLGPAFVYLLQGGPGGMAHALEQFDPARIPDWSHNVYPPITPELEQALDEQTRHQTGDRTIEEWEELRDEFLLRLIETKRVLFGEWERASRTWSTPLKLKEP